MNTTKVAQMCINTVKNLPSFFIDIKQAHDEVCLKIGDPSLFSYIDEYYKDKEIHLEKSALTHQEEEEIRGYKFIFLDENEEVRGGIFYFKVAEPQKERCRGITACRINEIPPPQEREKYSLRKSEEIDKIINFSNFFIQFDFKNFYDQIPLGEGVQKYFCFLDKNKKICCLQLLPMGWNEAPRIAQVFTWRFLDFDLTSFTATCVDNVGMGNEELEKLLIDAVKFVDRVVVAGGTLHDIGEDWKFKTIEEKKDYLTKNFVKTSFDFLGKNYDMTTKTKQNTEKTIKKIKLVKEELITQEEGPLKHRFIASVIGILRYAAHNVNFNLYKKFQMLKIFREIISECSKDINKWDEEISISKFFKEELIQMCEELEKGPRVPIVPYRYASSLLFFIDSSKDGAGFVGVNQNNTIFTTGFIEFRSEIQSSVQAEAEGIFLVLKQFHDQIQKEKAKVTIFTDHINLTFASKAKAPTSYFYNLLFLRIRDLFGDSFFFKFFYIPGTAHPADNLSRRSEFNQEDEKLVQEHLERYAEKLV